MTHTLRGCTLASLAITISFVSACTTEIWLSGTRDASTDAPIDASLRDAPLELDADRQDASDVPVDSDVPLLRDCELASVTITLTKINAELEQPTLAASGRGESLRYGVLVPPSASTIATEETRLIVTDREGAVVRERSIRLDDAGGAAASTATLHSLASGATEVGFLVLAPREIRLLDADGEEGPVTVVLATPPSSTWQRRAAWIDADRFVFVSETADLRLAVFDRRTGAVATTSISAAGAACVHIEPGGVTISSVGPLSETVVYDPDLSGAETLRTAWDDGGLLAVRLLGVGMSGGERTWLVNDANEFRAEIRSYRVSSLAPPVAGPTSGTLIGPFAASREGELLAIASSGAGLTVYSFETQTFSTVPTPGGAVIVEHERDGASLSILSLEPAGEGLLSLALTCGLD